MKSFIKLHVSGRFVDTRPVDFHGYIIHYNGTVIGKKGKPLKFEKRDRNGGGFDWCVRLNYNGKQKKWTASRLIGACFLGNIDGMEMNHLKRDPNLIGGDDVEISTRSENQKHWRKMEKDK